MEDDKIQLTVSWEDGDEFKGMFGERWTNGETKFLHFEDDKGVNESFIPTLHQPEFQKDFYTWYDTGSEKLDFRKGRFVTKNGITVSWKLPRDENNTFESAVGVSPLELRYVGGNPFPQHNLYT